LFRNDARAGFVIQNSSHNLSKLIDVVRFKTTTVFFNQNVVKLALEQAVESQRGSRSITVLFLQQLTVPEESNVGAFPPGESRMTSETRHKGKVHHRKNHEGPEGE
jgi:transcriptional regulator of aromatic amino acid metabolism